MMQAGSFSLYLDLEPGETASLEVIAKTSLAFVEAVRELAFILDPSLEIEIALVSGTEGSLSLNALFKSKKVKDLFSTKALIAAMTVSFMWFGGHARDWVLEKVLEETIGPESITHLSKEDLASIAETATEAVTKKLANGHVQQVYKELQADPTIKGVGATIVPATRPTNIVPRSEFPARAGSNVETIRTERKRTRESREWLTLVSPVLVEGDRIWEFTGTEGKISAPVKDRNFLHSVPTGATGLRLVSGIRLDVDLKTFEEFEDGAWHVKRRDILHVYGWTPEAAQHSLNIHSSHRTEDEKPP